MAIVECITSSGKLRRLFTGLTSAQRIRDNALANPTAPPTGKPRKLGKLVEMLVKRKKDEAHGKYAK